MLRMVNSLVESHAPPVLSTASSSTSSTFSRETGAKDYTGSVKAEVPRVPLLYPSRIASPLDSMIALTTLATHAGRQEPILEKQTQLQEQSRTPVHYQPPWHQPRMQAASGTFVHAQIPVESMQMHSIASTTQTHNQRPILLPSAIGNSNEQRHRSPLPSYVGQRSHDSYGPLAATSTVSVLGRKHKRGEPRGLDSTASPTSVWEDTRYGRGIITTTSPQSEASKVFPATTGTVWRVQPNISAMDPLHSASSPRNMRATAKDAASSSTVPLDPLKTPPLAPMAPPLTAATIPMQPQLIRHVSSKWRQDLSDEDRGKTRERIQRALYQHSTGEYETLLLIVAAMEEELLHIKAVSKEHYDHQTSALSDQIRTAILER